MWYGQVEGTDIVVLDPRNGYNGIPAGAIGQTPDGRWLIDLSADLPPGGKLSPGQSTTGHTITISENALQAHLAHGDTLGPCPVGTVPHDDDDDRDDRGRGQR